MSKLTLSRKKSNLYAGLPTFYSYIWERINSCTEIGKIITRIADKAQGLVHRLRDYPLESALCITYFLIWVFRVPIGNAFD